MCIQPFNTRTILFDVVYTVGMVFLLCHDDVICAGVELRGEVSPGTVLCFYPGTVVSLYVYIHLSKRRVIMYGD